MEISISMGRRVRQMIVETIRGTFKRPMSRVIVVQAGRINKQNAALLPLVAILLLVTLVAFCSSGGKPQTLTFIRECDRRGAKFSLKPNERLTDFF